MPTYYVEDYDGERNDDAVDVAPAETPATSVEDVTAKVVEAPKAKPAKKAAVKPSTKSKS